ncbi:hypothetical protein [Bifidobacterium animalis]|uniref:hypothetical protein n=1 Tax=Bifidobacterium animalis TaxID=28025 RepID=UPI003F922DA9
MTHTMIAHHINHIRARIPLLVDIRDRRIHLAPSGGMTGNVRPPVNLAALDTLDQLQALSYMLANTARIPRYWQYRPYALWQRLTDPDVIALLEHRDDAADIDRLLRQADQQTRHWTQPRPNLKLIGMCPHCNQPQWADEHTTPGETLTCAECVHDYIAGDLIASLYPALEWLTGTAAVLTRVINDTGMHISPSLIRKYAHKGWIEPTGHDRHGHPTYLMRDILDVWRTNLTNHA